MSSGREPRCCIASYWSRLVVITSLLLLQVVCSSCSVRKEVMPPAHGSKPVSRCVCRACVMTVLREDAKAVAIREINDPQSGIAERCPSSSLQQSGLFAPMSSFSTFNGARSLRLGSRMHRSVDMETGSRFEDSRLLLGDESRRRSATPRAPRERVAQANRTVERVKERRKEDVILRSERDTRQWDLSSSRVRSPQKTDTISSRSPPDTIARVQSPRRRQTVGSNLEAAHRSKNEMWLGDLLLTLCPPSEESPKQLREQEMRRRPHSKRLLVQRRRSFSLNSMEHTRLHHRHPIGAIQELRLG